MAHWVLTVSSYFLFREEDEDEEEEKEEEGLGLFVDLACLASLIYLAYLI